MNESVGYLLDSHVLLWWWFEPERLSVAVQSLIADSAITVLASAATLWELSLKHHQRTLPELAQAISDLPGLLKADGFQPLPIGLAHGLRAGAYSQPHRDPFDRMLAAQAELERLVLLMAFLLDTHALLWWLAEPERHSPAVHATVSNPGQPVYVSAASAWEIDTKHRLGRLPTADVLLQTGWPLLEQLTLLTLDPALDPFPCQALW